MSTKKRLYRSRTDKVLFGVCGGVAKYFGIDPVVVRVSAVALEFVTFGTLFIGYLVVAVLTPQEPQGEHTNG